ncbi:hypothetical protein Nepgr_010275 [Nepenthes gracilis]|uniref:Oberon PHD finger domain-containing protein n=1 Tax=Nepenthes gracilis TaxID=150966 RepID=A0AAD3SC20_NEPGR|nr:hypothetical protein Nepgr_010275 [Nepenthes gracilis]
MLSGVCSFCSDSSASVDNNGSKKNLPSSSCSENLSYMSQSNIINPSPFFWYDKPHLHSCEIEVVDSDAWRASSGLAYFCKSVENDSNIGLFSAQEVGDGVYNNPMLVKDDPDLDEIEDMRIHGNLFYKIDRSSREFDEYKFDFHRRKPSAIKDDEKGSKKKKNSSRNLAAEGQKSKSSKEVFRASKKETANHFSLISEEKLARIVKDKYIVCASLSDVGVSAGKKQRKPTFNQLTGPYHEPFCLDIYVSKGSVRACIVHRVTSKVVAVAHSISKDMKFDLGSTKNAAACAAVGKALAQRALADDIHDAIFTPRKGDKLEGKLQIVLQSIIENGVNVKDKAIIGNYKWEKCLLHCQSCLGFCLEASLSGSLALGRVMSHEVVSRLTRRGEKTVEIQLVSVQLHFQSTRQKACAIISGLVVSVSMTCELKEEPVDVDIPGVSNGGTAEIKENGLLLWPVLPQGSGEGLPYAPINFPDPGDTWGWRVGKRTSASGYYLDRYLFLPRRFQKSKHGKDGFASKLSVEQYVRARFPGVDVRAFFATFSWKIPSKQTFLTKEDHGSFVISSEEMAEQSVSDTQSATVVCKAGNRYCSSLSEEERASAVTPMICDVCCSEPGFCRDCCCILCCKTINSASGDYSFIRCEVKTNEGLICGHIAHINCALRSYMAGTVGGSIGLDAEYYCRRCDSKTDLVQHVKRLLKTCESNGSLDDIDKMLKLGICILRGSQKKSAKVLLSRIKLALQKLECGSDLEDVWKAKDNGSIGITGSHFREAVSQQDHSDSGTEFRLPHAAPELINSSNREKEYLKLDEEINQVLGELRKAQEYEYQVAQERLRAQRDYIFTLYQRLDQEKSELARCKRRKRMADTNTWLSAIADREDHIKLEVSKLKDMEMVAQGFGRTRRDILKEHFDLDIDE